MSDYTAIAGVSRTLRNLLRNQMDSPVDVTIAPPDVSITGMTDKRLNLYLYLVSENSYLKNQEIPGQGHPGAYGHPPLSLDLHYLLTAYGSNETTEDADLEAQRILGDAMRVLHDFATLTDELEITRSAVGTVGDSLLDTSLLSEFERIKITSQPLSLEDFSKLWTALPESNFRRSAAYMVSVVQIESKKPRRFPKLVGEPPPKGPRVYFVPFRSPQISEMRVIRHDDPGKEERPFPYARLDDILVIRGRNFVSQATRVDLGGLEIPVTRHADERIEVTIPDDTLPDGAIIPGERRLHPGSQSVSVVVGVAELRQTGFHSNQAVFMLVPYVRDRTLDMTTVPRTLKIEGTRLFLDTLSGETLVGRAFIPKTSYREAKPTEIIVPLPDTLPAWPVQCLISGDLSSFPSFTETPEVQVTIGSDGPRTANFTKPETLAEAAMFLEAGIRSAPGGGPTFKGARVTIAGEQLVVVPGGLKDTVTISDTAADQLKLTSATGAGSAQVYLSGELTPFPSLTASQPAVQLTIGGTTQIVTLDTRPTTLADATDKLSAAIHASFPGTQVTTLGDQLLIVPGAAGNMVFDEAPGDETTVAELQLSALYPVRVRVNGAESIDDIGLKLPL